MRGLLFGAAQMRPALARRAHISPWTAESGGRTAAAYFIHLHLAMTRPHDRLRCTRRRRLVNSDWAERRCAASIAPIDPPALTSVCLETCAADHKTIGTTSSGRAPHPRSFEDIAICDSGGGGVVGAEAAREQQRSPWRVVIDTGCEGALRAADGRPARPCVVDLRAESLLASGL